MPAANVVMVPDASTRRMRLLLKSAMKTSPLADTAVRSGVSSDAAVAGESLDVSLAGERGVRAAAVDAPHRLRARVGHEEVAGAGEREPGRLIELGRGGRAAVARHAALAVAGEGGHRPRRIGADAADDEVVVVGDVDVAAAVDRETGRPVEERADGRPAV